ncbi:MAG: NUDIX domain-containing protein [Desulfobacterales bacterium]
MADPLYFFVGRKILILKIRNRRCPIKRSAGLLVYRFRHSHMEVLLVHPGGPYWSRKDKGAWSIPKGEYAAEEDPLSAAVREFEEETGHPISGEFIPLSPVKKPGGKIVTAWAVEGDCDADNIESRPFTMEWPPHSGKKAEFPEVDRAGWFSIDQAKEKILKGQIGLLNQLVRLLNIDHTD